MYPAPSITNFIAGMQAIWNFTKLYLQSAIKKMIIDYNYNHSSTNAQPLIIFPHCNASTF